MGGGDEKRSWRDLRAIAKPYSCPASFQVPECSVALLLTAPFGICPDKRYGGRSKSIGHAYPHSVVVGERLRVIYPVNKEDIEIARVPLSELEPSSEQDHCDHRQASLDLRGSAIGVAKFAEGRRTAGDEHRPLPNR
jgi:hypothetical protein